ncbi:hypothetical protein EVAR_36680_1 [Eumeta japonica]|uniref:Uncharacterized protein n=1 Tax=Eumeta variegata TaxID=151549 RepID=A0A4C1ZAG0_EUMVA|nr:hypothetical protein EVAR_36680_1 [Eumeta japonica]
MQWAQPITFQGSFDLIYGHAGRIAESPRDTDKSNHATLHASYNRFAIKAFDVNGSRPFVTRGAGGRRARRSINLVQGITTTAPAARPIDRRPILTSARRFGDSTREGKLNR